MKAKSVAVVLLVAALSGVALAQKSFLYDDFSQPLLNPQKWATIVACYSGNGQEVECVRGIQNGALVLAHRNFGQTDSDTGSQFGGAFVNFINPASIKSITADVVVQNIQESPCTTNPQEFGGAVHFDATFFNAGTGNSVDDVGAQFGFSRVPTDPKGQIFVWAQIYQGSNYFGFVPIGFAYTGTPVTATLTWDQKNHQFVATASSSSLNKQITLPYTMSDTTPATNPAKDFAVDNFPANCTSNHTLVYVGASFDNVHISQ
jgi:hypothetical protein